MKRILCLLMILAFSLTACSALGEAAVSLDTLMDEIEEQSKALGVGALSFEISPNGQSIFIDRPEVTGCEEYTIAYNIYDSDSNPVNYFYSLEERVAATPGYAGLFNVFVVVTDTATGEQLIQNIGWQTLVGPDDPPPDQPTYEPLQVGAATFEISQNLQHVFIDRPAITGGSGQVTIAYNIYDSDSNPVNYFYSDEARVAATPGYKDRFNVFIVVTDLVTGETNTQNIGWNDLIGPNDPLPETEGLIYTPIDDGAALRVTGYEGTDTEVIIPSTHEGLPVTEIGEGAFAGMETLRKMVIGEGVTVIRPDAFNGCLLLTDFTFPSTLKVIGQNAFRWCGRDMEEVFYLNLPDGMEDITGRGGGATTFSDINAVLVTGKTSQTAALLTDRNYCYAARGETDFRYRYESYTEGEETGRRLWLVGYTGNAAEVSIPEGIYGIKRFSSNTESPFWRTFYGNAFYGNGTIRKVVIPEGTVILKDGSFIDCFLLTDFTSPSTLKVIEQNTFRWCGRDVDEVFYLDLPDEMEDITGRGGGATTFSDINGVLVTGKTSKTAALLTDRNYCYAARGETDFRYRYESYTEGEETGRRLWLVGYTGNAAEVSIPEGIYGIKCFSSNTESPFWRTFYGNAFYGNETIRKVVIPEGTVILKDGSFMNCFLLTDFTFPSTLKIIEQNAFRWCGRDVEEVFYLDLPDEMEDITGRGGGATTFSDINAVLVTGKTSQTAELLTDRNYCYAARGETDFRYRYEAYNDGGESGRELWLVGYTGTDTEVSIPMGIYGIKRFSSNTESTYWRTFYGNAFYNNTAIEKVVIPEGTVVIEDSAFLGCVMLADISFPGTLQALKNHAFEKCGSGCGRVYYYFLPDNMTEIAGIGGAGWESFNGITGYLVATPDTSTAYILSDGNYNFALTATYADGLLYRYENREIDGVKKYRLYVYDYVGSSAEVIIPEGVGVYGVSRTPPGGSDPWHPAFYNDDHIEKVVIPAGVAVISDSAFANCSMLHDVNLPASVKILYNHAFENTGHASGVRWYIVLPAGLEQMTGNNDAGWASFNKTSAVLVAPAGSVGAQELYEHWWVYYHSLEDAQNQVNLCYKPNDDPDFEYLGNM